MKWKPFADISENIKAPAGYTIRQLRASEVETVVEKLVKWYPGIVVGGESSHLDPDFYYKNAFFEEGDACRLFMPLVALSGDEPVGLLTLFKNSLSKDIYSRMGAIAQEHRGRKLSYLGPLIIESMGKAIGAGLAYYHATLLSPHQQIIAEKSGFQLAGIMPGNDLEMVAPNMARRVFEAIYAKVLVPDSELYLPTADCLTEKTKTLWGILFSATSWRIDK